MDKEFRMQKVMARLESEPVLRLAIMTDGESVPDMLILTAAIRGLAAFEAHIPKAKVDAFKLCWLINQQGGTITE